MLHVILREGLYDKGFHRRDVRNVDALAAAVRPFGARAVAEHAGIDAGDLVHAARSSRAPDAATWSPGPVHTLPDTAR